MEYFLFIIMPDCQSLKVGDKCDQCGKGTMRPTGRKWWDYHKWKNTFRKSNEGEEIECDECGHRHTNFGVVEYFSASERVSVNNK